MKNRHFDWKLISISEIAFWSGVIIISIINIILTLRNKDVLSYDFYISGISVIAIIVFTIILIKKKKSI